MTKALSAWSMNTALTRVTQPRQSLWFHQWRLCGKYRLPLCRVLRRLDHDWIDRCIDLRRDWQTRRVTWNYGGSWRGDWQSVPITAQDIQALHAMCDFLITDATPRKIVVSQDTLAVYANDHCVYDRIHDLGLANLVQITEAVLTGEPNTVRLKHSAHQLRSYLRRRRLPSATAHSVRGWLLAQSDVKLSPSLQDWCLQHHDWMYAHYFLDHDAASTAHMLDLMVPGLVRTTLPIVLHK